jgi:uncharacterized protein
LVLLTGFGAVAYGLAEAKRHRVVTHTLPVLPPAAAPIRILQVSDLHLRLGNRAEIKFLESLAGVTCDLVLATGDLLGSPSSLNECLRLLNGLNARHGRFFVFGSSDYYAPKFKSYFEYFRRRTRLGTNRNPTQHFRSGLVEAGWKDLNNASLDVELAGIKAQITGMDDPYIRRDDRRVMMRGAGCDLAVMVVHDPRPYADAAAAGFDLIVSGHTHGGQVRLPFLGALVTNSTLPTDRARGASRIGNSWLFVSPGVGTSKFAPFRFLCPPEASLLELIARD